MDANIGNLSIPYLLSLIGFSQEKPFLDLMAYIMIGVGIVVYIALQFMPAPYGRYSSVAYGPQVDSRLAWIVQESPSFFIPILVYIFLDNGTPNIENLVLTGLFILHYFQRTFIYGPMIRGGKTTSLATALLAFIFCAYNGFLQSRSILKFRDLSPKHAILFHPFFVAGVAIFLIGMFVNIHSDAILRSLRSDGKPGYKIPRGGLFELVTAANYFGEIVEWGGFAMASGQLQGLAFFLFTIFNLVPRAVWHHDWYLNKFRAEYPRDRTAIIPFLI